MCVYSNPTCCLSWWTRLSFSLFRAATSSWVFFFLDEESSSRAMLASFSLMAASSASCLHKEQSYILLATLEMYLLSNTRSNTRNVLNDFTEATLEVLTAWISELEKKPTLFPVLLSRFHPQVSCSVLYFLSLFPAFFWLPLSYTLCQFLCFSPHVASVYCRVLPSPVFSSSCLPAYAHHVSSVFLVLFHMPLQFVRYLVFVCLSLVF